MRTIGLYAFSQSDGRPISDRVRLAVSDFAPFFPQSGQKIVKDARGKPFFDDARLQLSISHSGEYWVLALCDVPVGVDVQFMQHDRREARFEKIARRFFHPHEISYVTGAGPEHFYEVWTKKESYVKLTGSGINSQFGSFNVFDLPVYFESVSLAPTYTLSVCSYEKCHPILKLF